MAALKSPVDTVVVVALRKGQVNKEPNIAIWRNDACRALISASRALGTRSLTRLSDQPKDF